MSTWFECKFQYNQEDQNGGFRKITETYLIDAVSFTEAETRVYREIGSNYRDFKLLKVSKYKVTELIFGPDAVKWFKVKVSVITLDEKSGKEKKSNQVILVSSDNAKEAYTTVEDLFSDSTSDYEITDVSKTNIVEILPYVEPVTEEAK